MLINYLKITWKVLLRNKLFTSISLFGISLTLTILIIGASFFDYIFKPSYPNFKQDRILYVNYMEAWEEKLGENSHRNHYSGDPSYYFLGTYVKPLQIPELISIYSSNLRSIKAFINSKKAELVIRYSDADYWNILDFEFVVGRPFNKTEVENAQKVAVIARTIAEDYYGGIKPAIGKTIEADKISYTIIGVVKNVPVTSLNTYGNIWTPITTSKEDLSSRKLHGGFAAMLLAKHKSDFSAIESEFQRSVRKMELPFGNFNFFEVGTASVLGMFLRPFQLDISTFYMLLFGIILITMLIPSLNLINLNVNRINERLSEIGVRKSFGARKMSLVWQFLIENIVLTFMGGLVAFVLSYIILKTIQSTGIIPLEGLLLNYRIFSIGLIFCLCFGFISGFLPAYRMSNLQIVESLK